MYIRNGYVYILTNSAFPELIKIGKTARDSKLRAKELSTTSVPTAFKVAFEIFSEDFDNIEKEAHIKLEDFRVNQNREFFRYPLNEAIKLLQNLNDTTQTIDEEFEAVDITESIVSKYPNHLRDDIVSVRIVQPNNRVWLEITSEDTSDDGTIINQTIRREDLAFIADGDGIDEEYTLYFNPADSVQINATKYIEGFDPYSIINTSNLFKEEYCQKISDEYWRNKK